MRFVGHALVDWDDTIAENIRYFNEAEEANALLIARLTAHDAQTIRKRGQEIDLATARRIGLGRESFSIAWIECYRELCGLSGLPADGETEAALGRACQMPYEVRQDLLPGAAGTLAWLYASGFEVIIWTAGDSDVQARKIQNSGLEGYIHRAEIVPDKDPERLTRALAGRDRRHCFVVGNSVHSDIRPALAVGIAAYHVPAETWAYDHGRLDFADPNYERLERIADLPRVLGPRFGLEDEAAGSTSGA
ncbi:MAG TPA: HAD family hydrolase [Symbiobacteriaceae bacterium]|jgi:putative hydrolase of the HAD superfamily